MYKKSITGGIVLLFLLSSSVPFVSSYEVSTNNIIYVDDDGGADYTRIQDAIDNASDGDTVFVYSGIYNDYFPDNLACVRIEKNITLIGENKHNTIINNEIDFQRVVIIKSEEVSISGFTIQHGREIKESAWILGIDIHYYKAENIKIFDNIVKNNSYGISTHQSSANIHIYDNLIMNNYYGIECEFDSAPLNIYRNVITNNEFGIYSIYSQIYLTNNFITNNKVGINNIGSLSNYTIASNEIRDNKVGIILKTAITTITHNNLINNDKQVDLTTDFLMISFLNFLLYRTDWISNYWDDWNTGNPRPIKGRVYINIVIFRFTKFEEEIRIAFFPYFEYDENPAQEPYDIPVGGA